jgi:hypothetical protein
MNHTPVTFYAIRAGQANDHRLARGNTATLKDAKEAASPFPYAEVYKIEEADPRHILSIRKTSLVYSHDHTWENPPCAEAQP